MTNRYPGGVISLGGQIPSRSVLFNGSSQYLSVATNAAFAFGTGDFTIELWLYTTSSGQQHLYDGRSGGGTDKPLFYINPSTQLSLYAGSSAIITSSVAVPLNTWTHCALVRYGTTVSIFQNGLLVATGSNSTNWVVPSSTPIYIGVNDIASGSYFSGYMSNYRVVKGTAVYTSNFVPPKGPATNISGTSLLTCQSPTIVDNSSNGFTITNSGTATVSTLQPNFQAYNPNLLDPALGAATPGVWTLDQAMNAEVTRSWPMYDPYYKNVVLNLHGNSGVGGSFASDASTNNFSVTVNGDARSSTLTPFSTSLNFPNGSGYFDGSGDYLLAATSAAGAPGTGDFCAEAWIYPQNSTDMSIITNLVGSGGSDTQWGLFMNTGSNYLRFQGWFTVYLTGNAPSLNTWSHVVACRSGTTLSLFLNGTRLATTSTANNFSSTNDIRVGAYASGTSPFTGNISNARFVKGSSVYDPTQSTITVPTAPLTAISGTSLLTVQTPNPANNNGFLDSSSNNFAITRNGNTTQGSFSPYSQNYSNYFTITGYNSLSVTSSSAFDFGTGDFTVETWIFPIGITTYGWIFGTAGSNTANAMYIVLSSLSTVSAETYFNGSSRVSATNSGVQANQWNHVAVVRVSGVVTVYVNGVGGTGVSMTNSMTSATPRIGSNTDESVNGRYNGYISNLRVVKGTALYKTSFTPSAAPLTAVSGTSLLTCQSNRYKDNSSNGFTVTPSGEVSVQRFQPFLFNTSYTPSTIGGSGYFDGSGDYLSAASNSAFYLSTGDFTVEAWVYKNSSGRQIIVGQTQNTSAPYAGWYLYVSSSNFATFEGTSGSLIASSSTFPLNQWVHVAAVKSSSTTTLYVNGASVASGTVSITDFNSTLNIGQYTSPISGSEWNGYISNLRIVKGTAIVPPVGGPTSPLTAVTNTSLLLSMTNAGIVDNAMMNDLETVGNAQISTSVKKYGTGSMYFDGTGDYLVSASSPSFAFTGNVTIECWIYASVLNGSGSTAYAICGTHSGVSDSKTLFYVYGTGKIGVGKVGTNEISSATGIITVNNWYHVAAVRNGTTTTIYVNGVSVASNTTDVWSTGTSPIYVGYANPSNGVNWNGYLDDLRITQGVARYTANFTPPTSQLQDQ